MIVNLDLQTKKCSVIKEKNDKKYHRGYALPESTFLFHVKRELIKQGYDVIKKRMWRDGHMVDDLQQYIRTRNYSLHNLKGFALYNSAWAIRDVGEVFNNIEVGDFVTLDVVY